jgi:glycosyltransferase involved in cell wall biosynthesis
MKKALILVLSNLRHDARVRRQLNALKDNYKTTIVCFEGDASPDYELIAIQPTKLTLLRKSIASVFLLLKFHSIAYKILHNYSFVAQRLADRRYDVVIANDVETLPLAFEFKGSPKVIFDAHEYAPRHFEDKKIWRLFFQDFNTWLCKKYIPLTAAMTTVGKGLAEEYKKHFHVSPVVITNANNYVNLSPSPMVDNKIRLVHHGIATPSRKLELMIEMMNLLDERFTLDLILMVPGFASKKTRQYIDDLRRMAQTDPRINIIPPVSSSEVVATVHKYDIGVFLIPPINFNYRNTLPNKLFDFIQARLGVAIGPTPEMAQIVTQYNTGVVSKDFTPQSLALELNKLTKSDIENYKRNSGTAAGELNAEANAKKMNEIVAAVLR